MQKTFMALKYLELGTNDPMAPVVSDSFLGGSAPHLRHLRLCHIPFPFPVLRKLLLSAPNLIKLVLRDIPHSGYVSPGEGQWSLASPALIPGSKYFTLDLNPLDRALLGKAEILRPHTLCLPCPH